ncbi:MAG: septum site-determining protein MinC [Mycobacterium leprae]
MRQDIVIRGTTKSGLSIVLPDDMELDAALGRLQEKLTQGGRFFQGAEVTVLVGRRNLAEKDRKAIGQVLQEAQMVLRRVGPGGDPVAEGQAVVRAQDPGHSSGGAATSPQPGTGKTLVVNRTLRSGQLIRHEGDVVVLGDVNPGAEIVASGNIVVMGALRGVAHAGCTGNVEAIVAAAKLRPTQLRIAQVIGRSPDEQEELQAVPEVARVRDGIIVVETPTEPKR